MKIEKIDDMLVLDAVHQIANDPAAEQAKGDLCQPVTQTESKSPPDIIIPSKISKFGNDFVIGKMIGWQSYISRHST